ncbi:hypothetical protein AB0H82_10190 [Streptomyces sp. NPDC050732]|uniref:hypothetical protein n=1 Tax=Streptomyces sp. NPDC050732 TaxID=3154632 RepID=UPI003418B4D3
MERSVPVATLQGAAGWKSEICVTPVPGWPVTSSGRRRCGAALVAAESREGCVRTAFKHWADADQNQCTRRAELLTSEYPH